MVQQQLVDIFCDGLTFDYLRMKIIRKHHRDLGSAIQAAMREQNVRQYIRGANVADGIQNNDHRHNSSSFDTTTPFLNI